MSLGDEQRALRGHCALVILHPTIHALCGEDDGGVDHHDNADHTSGVFS
jgi:hypothetical protein